MRSPGCGNAGTPFYEIIKYHCHIFLVHTVAENVAIEHSCLLFYSLPVRSLFPFVGFTVVVVVLFLVVVVFVFLEYAVCVCFYPSQK